jgi:hypothetical protein
MKAISIQGLSDLIILKVKENCAWGSKIWTAKDLTWLFYNIETRIMKGILGICADKNRPV